MSKIKFAKIISTVYYIGNNKYCPRILGSLIGILLFPILLLFIAFCLPSIYGSLFDLPFYLIVIWIILFILGTYTSKIYAQHINISDPKQIIIDEVVGQLLTIILCLPVFLMNGKISLACIPIFLMNGMVSLVSIKIIHILLLIYCILPFILFRFFDILKPWPINWVNKNIKGGIGTMLDDILTAIFAAIVEYVIIFFL